MSSFPLYASPLVVKILVTILRNLEKMYRPNISFVEHNILITSIALKKSFNQKQHLTITSKIGMSDKKTQSNFVYLNLKLVGESNRFKALKYSFSAGTFVSKENLNFIDYNHVKTTPTFLYLTETKKMDAFHSLKLYVVDNDSWNMQFHCTKDIRLKTKNKNYWFIMENHNVYVPFESINSMVDEYYSLDRKSNFYTETVIGLSNSTRKWQVQISNLFSTYGWDMSQIKIGFNL